MDLARLALLVAATAATTSCGGGGDGAPTGLVPVGGVVITSPAGPPVFRTLGRTVQFAAEARSAQGSLLAGRAVAFSSNNTAVATVTAAGLVTAVSAGTASITASSEGRNSTAVQVTVDPLVVNLAVTPGTVTFGTKGRTRQLVLDARDSANNAITGKPVTWNSTSAAVATVDNAGLATAVANGTAQVSASVDGQAAAVAVTVAIVAAQVLVTPGAVTFGAKGSTRLMAAAVQDSGGAPVAGGAVTWGTVNPAVATVSLSGLVTSVDDGATSVTATSGTVNGSATVTVARVTASVAMSPTSHTFTAVNRNKQFTATPLDSNGNALAGRPAPIWVGPGPYFTVNATGLVTSLGPGTPGLPNLHAGIDNATGNASVTVLVTEASVDVLPDTVHFDRLAFQSRTLGAVVVDTGGGVVTAPNVSWVSRDAAVATVNFQGLANPAGNGATWLVAQTPSGARDSALAVVQQVAAHLLIDQGGLNIPAVGFTRQMMATVSDSGQVPMASPPAVTWSSAGPGLVTVSPSGLATANAPYAAGPPDTVIVNAVGGYGPITARDIILSRQYAKAVQLTSASVTPDTLMTTGRTRQFSASPIDSNNVPIVGQLTWTSLTPAVATVSQTGLVTAASDGTSQIQVEVGVGGLSPVPTELRPMVVRRYASTFSVNPSGPVTVQKGAIQQFALTAQDSNGTVLAVSFTSRDLNVASIFRTGSVGTATGIGAGSTYIVYSGGQRTDSTQITVLDPLPAPAASVTVGDVFFRSVSNATQNPAVDTVAVGGTVTWNWAGAASHGVLSTGAASFVSSTVKTTGSYAVTFNLSGTFTYECTVHGSSMSGRIVVR